MRTVQLLAGSTFCRVATGEEGCIDDGSAGELSAKATRDVARVVITAISFTNTTVSASLFDRRHTRIVVILKPISAWSCLSILRFLRVCGVRLRWHISALTRIALRILRHYDTVNLELTVCRIDCALQHPISTLNVRMFNSCIESSRDRHHRFLGRNSNHIWLWLRHWNHFNANRCPADMQGFCSASQWHNVGCVRVWSSGNNVLVIDGGKTILT